MSDGFEKTNLNRVKRIPDRGAYDKASVYKVVDDAIISYVGFVVDDRPFVIPTIHARRGDEIIFHGSAASRMMKHIQAGHDFCVNVTHLDGLVLARSVFHSSMNYRSAVLFGKGRLVEDYDEKMEALKILTERLMPGRWDDARLPKPIEMKATSVVVMPIDSASAKVRTGPPGDDEEDYALSMWAGVVPIQRTIGQPIDDPRLNEGIEVPEYVRTYMREK